MADFLNYEPKFLEMDELEYELSIRRVRAKAHRSSKVKTLERAIATEKPIMRDRNFVVAGEVATIDNKLTNITTRIVELDHNLDVNSVNFRRVRSRIIQITQRINRFRDAIPPNDETYTEDQVEDQIETWTGTVLELESDLLERLSPNQVLSNTFNTTVQGAVDVQKAKSVPVCKWNLTYDGKSDLLPFLEKVNDLMMARHVSERELFLSAYDLFQEPALSWYRSVRSTVDDWPALVTLMKQVFLPSDYDDKVWDEINSRKQARNESLAIFVAVLNNLFERLTKTVKDETRLRVIKKNMLPHYTSALVLHTYDSVDELLSLGKRIDEAYAHKRNSIEPKKVHTLNTESIPRNEPKNPPRGPSKHNVKEAPAPSSPSSSKSLNCWNCGLANHLYSSCKAKKGIFCYRCGRRNVTTHTCPKCASKNSEN